MNTVDERVAHGARLLDAELGREWVDRIDLSTLAISSIHDCILGQVFGTYERGAAVLNIDHVSMSSLAYDDARRSGEPVRAIRNGFWPRWGVDDDDLALDCAWTELILARRRAA